MSITSGEFYTPRNLGSRRGGNVTSLLAGRALKAEAAYAGGWRKGMKGKKGEKLFTKFAYKGGWTPSKVRRAPYIRKGRNPYVVAENLRHAQAARRVKYAAALRGGWHKGMKGKKGEKPFTAAARRGGWTPSKFRQTSFKRGVAFLSDAQMASRSPYSSTNMTTSTYNMNTRGRNEFFNPDERPAKKEKIHPYTFIANNPIWGST